MGKPFTVALAFALLALPLACGDDDDSTGATGGKGGSTGGSTAKGGTGGTTTGGSTAKGGTGGTTTTGGSPAKGGTGGTATGGTATGGASTGGSTAKGGTGGTPVETGGSGGVSGGGGEETGGTGPIVGGGGGAGGDAGGVGGGGAGGDGGSGGGVPDPRATLATLIHVVCTKEPLGQGGASGSGMCPDDTEEDCASYLGGAFPPLIAPASPDCLDATVDVFECAAAQDDSEYTCLDGFLNVDDLIACECNTERVAYSTACDQ